MHLDMLVREVTGYIDEPAPWHIEETDGEIAFRWGTLEAHWQHPLEEDLIEWVREEAETLQRMCVAYVQEAWEEPLRMMIAQHLLAAGVPTKAIEQMGIFWDVESEWPPHGEMAGAAYQLPKGRLFVEAVWEEVADEAVGMVWEGGEQRAEVAAALAARMLNVWNVWKGNL
ncbi:hypothetical protein ARMA_1940 [Ardenticatena maritima]|uniref:Uncharacterized protein n=2 Tax=Ardenticatena maritima TaxID=872965 RepID=A0A0M9UD27_9CHLR|nr:hypothetical protein [Ardenticatena maritima]KPL87121.1 hypothetical protein SE16_11245 [Ardenticatena maritima]GAP63517.1 hypothetical protein ARMA_1940 [Ardenticatena maritima]